MLYWTILNLVSYDGCLECDIKAYPEHLRDEARLHYRNHEAEPRCRVYRRNFKSFCRHKCFALSATYFLAQYENLHLLLKWYCQKVFSSKLITLALVECNACHADATNAGIWHTDHLMHILEEKNMDGENFTAWFSTIHGMDYFWQNYHLLLDIAIRYKYFRLYQDLIGMCRDAAETLRDNSSCYGNYHHDDMMKLFQIADTTNKLEILMKIQHYGCSPEEWKQLALTINWSQVTHDKIRRLIQNVHLVVTNATDIAILHTAGLCFSMNYFCCDANVYYQMQQYGAVSDLICPQGVFLDLNVMQYFSETLAFTAGYFEVCFLHGCQRAMIAVVERFVSDMPASVVKMGLDLSIRRIFDTGLLFWSTVKSIHNTTNRLMAYLEMVDTGLLKEVLTGPILKLITVNNYRLFQHTEIKWPQIMLDFLSECQKQEQALHNVLQYDVMDSILYPKVLIDYLYYADCPDHKPRVFQHTGLSLAADIGYDPKCTKRKHRFLLPKKLDWAQYLILVAGCEVKQVVAIANHQGYRFSVEKFSLVLTPEYARKKGFCHQHDKCFYRQIITRDLATTIKDLAQYDILSSEVAARIQPWLSGDA